MTKVRTPTQRLYYFTSERYALEALRDSRLKISRIGEVNDPFEFLGLCVGKAERRILNRLKEQLGRTRGIMCLSATWQNPLLWAHYGGAHRGIALRFDIDAGLFEPVQYVTARNTLAELGMSSLSEMNVERMRSLLMSKFHQWSYEAEYRSFCSLEDADPVTGLFFKEFAREMTLRTVILGARSTASREQLRRVIGNKYPGVMQIKARPAFKTFEVVENKLKSAWK